MTISKKGSRKITVDNITYRWSIRRKPTYDQECMGSNMLASVELYLTSCCTLSIEFQNVRFDNLVKGIENAKRITPKIIEFCIKDAKNKGWKPEINGGTFKYKYDID